MRLPKIADQDADHLEPPEAADPYGDGDDLDKPVGGPRPDADAFDEAINPTREQLAAVVGGLRLVRHQCPQWGRVLNEAIDLVKQADELLRNESLCKHDPDWLGPDD